MLNMQSFDAFIESGADSDITVAGFFKERRGVAVNDDKLKEHIASALARGWPEHPWERPHNGRALICGAGPSMADPSTLKKIRRLANRKNNHVSTVNKTETHFLSLGRQGLGANIKSDFHVLIDPKEIVKTYVTPQRGTDYFIASQCHPSVLDVFAPDKFTKFLYHHGAAGDGLDGKSHTTPPLFSTVGGESILVLYRLGFRKFELFGMESSYSDGKLHGYAKTKEYLDRIPIMARDPKTGDEKTYVTNGHMACQAEDFRIFAQYWDFHVKAGHYEAIEVTVHGEGLLPASAHFLNRQFDWITNGIRSRL